MEEDTVKILDGNDAANENEIEHSGDGLDTNETDTKYSGWKKQRMLAIKERQFGSQALEKTWRCSTGSGVGKQSQSPQWHDISCDRTTENGGRIRAKANVYVISVDKMQLNRLQEKNNYWLKPTDIGLFLIFLGMITVLAVTIYEMRAHEYSDMKDDDNSPATWTGIDESTTVPGAVNDLSESAMKAAAAKLNGTSGVIGNDFFDIQQKNDTSSSGESVKKAPLNP